MDQERNNIDASKYSDCGIRSNKDNSTGQIQGNKQHTDQQQYSLVPVLNYVILCIDLLIGGSSPNLYDH